MWPLSAALRCKEERASATERADKPTHSTSLLLRSHMACLQVHKPLCDIMLKEQELSQA